MAQHPTGAALLLSLQPAEYLSTFMNPNYRTFKFVSFVEGKVIKVVDGELMDVRTDKKYKFTGIEHESLYCLICPKVYYPRCDQAGMKKCDVKHSNLNDFKKHLKNKIQYFKLQLYSDIDVPLICSFDSILPGDLYGMYDSAIEGTGCEYLNEENGWTRISEVGVGHRCDIKNCKCRIQLTSIKHILNHAATIERATGLLVLRISPHTSEEMDASIDIISDDADKMTDHFRTDFKTSTFFGIRWYKQHKTKKVIRFRCRKHQDKRKQCKSIITFDLNSFEAEHIKVLDFKPHLESCADNGVNCLINDFIVKQIQSVGKESEDCDNDCENHTPNTQKRRSSRNRSTSSQPSTKRQNRGQFDHHFIVHPLSDSNDPQQILSPNNAINSQSTENRRFDNCDNRLHEKLTRVEIENDKLKETQDALNSNLEKISIERNHSKEEVYKLASELDRRNQQFLIEREQFEKNYQAQIDQLQKELSSKEELLKTYSNRPDQSSGHQQRILDAIDQLKEQTNRQFDQLKEQSTVIQSQTSQQFDQQIAFNRSMKLFNSNANMVVQKLQADSVMIDRQEMHIQQIQYANSILKKKSEEKQQDLINKIAKLKMQEISRTEFLKSINSFHFYSIGLNCVISVKDKQIQLDSVERSCYRTKENCCLVCPQNVFVTFRNCRPCKTKNGNFSKFKVHLLSICAKYRRQLIFLNNEYIPEIHLLRKERELTDMSRFLKCDFEILNKKNLWVPMNDKSRIKCDLLNCEESKCEQILHSSKSNFLLHVKSIEHKSACYLIRETLPNQNQQQNPIDSIEINMHQHNDALNQVDCPFYH